MTLTTMALGTAAGSMPVFLDGMDTIRMALPEPAPLGNLSGRLTLHAASGDIPVVDVQPGSPPVRDSRLPRDPGRVVLAGSFQSALGGAEWDPDSDATRMAEVRPGVYDLVVSLPRGRYEYKVARGGSWGENYGAGFAPGGRNIPLDVERDATVVRFEVDFNARTIRDSISDPAGLPAPSEAPARPEPPAGPARYEVAVLRLARKVAVSDVAAPMTLEDRDGPPRPVIARDVLSARAFTYTGDDLGSRWSPRATTFKVWSPVSASADLLLFRGAAGGPYRTVAMKRGAAGVWYARVPGDLHGVYYRYRFRSYGAVREAADINCFAASADASRSMVVDLARTRPPGWPGPRLQRRHSYTDAVIYELHVRDFTVQPSSGVRPDWRGRYLGLVEPGTRGPGATGPTGLDYLVDLGITDVHLLPIQSSVTLRAGGPYGWGYATTLFNVPEESFATAPDDPVSVIRETRQMIAGLHRAGLRAVMDVVYNHTWPPDGPDSAFAQTVPFYYTRTNDRGEQINESGVGNAVADERPMVRKFIRESLLHWLREYNVDGFRFDLLGMHTPASVAGWAAALRAARPDVLLYGEPWTGGGPVRYGKGAQRGMGVAVFNDTFRGAFRGDTDGSSPGFAMGASLPGDLLRAMVSGSPRTAPGGAGFTDSPAETINYVSAHDNLTLWDKVRLAMPGAPAEDHARAVILATAAVLLSEGIPFVEGGAEIGRTKGGDPNTYDANDAVNGFHWERAPEFRAVHDAIRGLIALRRAFPALRLPDAASVARDLRFLDALPDGTVAWETPAGTGTGWKRLLVVLHGSRQPAEMPLPEGKWSVLAAGDAAALTPLRTLEGALPLAPLSACVLAR